MVLLITAHCCESPQKYQSVWAKLVQLKNVTVPLIPDITTIAWGVSEVAVLLWYYLKIY